MKIPTFKRSDLFLGRYNVPCLVAKVRNSRLPGVANRHIANLKSDPICEIYLRSKDSQKISTWQKTILEELLKQETLSAVIEEAMKEYGKYKDAYSGASAKDLKKIQKAGIAPFMTVSMIVIDEIESEAILTASTEWDGNLLEHGVSIYLQNGQWHFDYADHFTDYSMPFEKEKDSGGDSQRDFVSKKWDILFPPGEPDTPVEKNFTLLNGTWEFYPRETKKVMRKLGYPSEQISESMIFGVNSGLSFSTTTLVYLRFGMSFVQESLLGCERKGNRISLRTQSAGQAVEIKITGVTGNY